jgi:putative membrane protein
MSEPPLGVVVPDTRLHPIQLIINTGKALRQAIPFLFVTIFGGAPWWVIAGLCALVVVTAVAQWSVKKYSVVGGVLALRSGLVNRSVRIVPITRITALEASQSPTQRLCGVWVLNVRSPGDRNGAALSLACLSGRRLDEIRVTLGSGDRTTAPAEDLQEIAVLRTVELLIAAVTSYPVCLIFLAALVLWFRFSYFLPVPAADFMEEVVAPQGPIAVLITLVAVAIAAGVVLGVLRLHRFALVRDGDVLRSSRGLFARQSTTIPIHRVQAVRLVEGISRMLLGYCSLQVELAGIGRTDVDQRLLFPLVRMGRAEELIRRALPELPWPSQPLLVLPARLHRRYLTLPLEYGAGFTLLMLFLPGRWALLAVVPLPVGYVLGVARAREARWQVDDRCVVLRWRRVLSRNTVVAHRGGSQLTEFSSSPWKAKKRVAGFTMRFSSGRHARIRYMADADALLLLHTVGRVDPVKSTHNR